MLFCCPPSLQARWDGALGSVGWGGSPAHGRGLEHDGIEAPSNLSHSMVL